MTEATKVLSKTFTAELITRLRAAGYRVHQGMVDDKPDLVGRWWWTLFQPGWSGCDVSEGDWATEEEAWGDAAIHYVSERLDA